MINRIKRLIVPFLTSRFVVRLFCKEIKVGIRENIFIGNTLVFINTCHPNGKFKGVVALAALAIKYDLPVHVHIWFRHEEGVRHSYFTSSGVFIGPNDSEASLRVACERIEGSRSMLLTIDICEPDAELHALNPITM